jgi:hypothetical protein
MRTGTDANKSIVKVIANILPIGDALTCVPWLLALAAKHGTELYVQGPFNAAVQELLGSLPLRFDLPSDQLLQDHGHVVLIQAAYSRYHGGSPDLHIAQAHFALVGMDPPSLPLTLPLLSTPTDLPASVVISPFSAHDRVHNRCWFDERWNAVIDVLLNTHGFPVVYVIASPLDDVRPFERPGVRTVVGRPLSQIVDLIARSPLFLSIDTGPSHIAHFIGKWQHLLLYPAFFSQHWACNPHGRKIQERPIDLTVERVLDAVNEMLAGCSP